MAKKFNIESYRSELNVRIAELTAKVEELNKNRRANFWQIRDIEDEIENLKLRVNPKFVCELCYSDRHAYEILNIISEKSMIVRRLIAKRINIGEHYMSDAQDYEFKSNSKAPGIVIRLRKDGFFYESGNSTPFQITAEPYEYFDYSF